MIGEPVVLLLRQPVFAAGFAVGRGVGFAVVTGTGFAVVPGTSVAARSRVSPSVLLLVVELV